MLPIIGGHLRVEPCRKLGIPVPTIPIDGLSDAEVKALRLSLNKLAEQSSWDPEALAAEFADLLSLDADLIGFTGFTMPEVDRWLLQAGLGLDGPDSDDAVVAPPAVPVSRLGHLRLFAGGTSSCAATAERSRATPPFSGTSRCRCSPPTRPTAAPSA